MKRRSSFRYCNLIVALLLCAPHCWAQSSAPKPAAPSAGQITGRVVSSAGEPLAGASVSVSSFSRNALPKIVQADDRGDFKVAGLEPGLYSVFASLPGFVGNSASAASDGPKYYRVGDSITLSLTKGGVITGNVTGPQGPLVGLGIFATRVKDGAGHKIFTAIPSGYERRTDDRGVFRFYGLPPGAYVLTAMRPRSGTILPSPYDNDVPTFYPSGTRDTAAEIVVREGDEINANIQYRGGSGHAITGKISGFATNQPQFGAGPQIYLTDVRDRIQVANGATSLTDPSGFALYGVPDGEYELSARQFLQTREELRSAPQRIKVRGADVTGINLTLAPLASIAGRLIFEPDPKAECGKRKDTAAAETLVYARRLQSSSKSTDARNDDSMPLEAINGSWLAASDVRGSFIVWNLFPGAYRIDLRPPAGGWYVRSIAMGPATTTAARNIGSKPDRDGVSVRSAEHVTGVTVTFTEGGALLSGRVSVAASQSPPVRLQIYLVPAEREAAENVYRFYEASVEADGAFTVDNLAPGTYWIVARRAEENDKTSRKFVRQDAALRSSVRQEAEATKKAVSLRPCEQLKDFEVPAPR